MDEAGLILRKAYDNGINFYDTARGYTDSEEKIGYALSGVRKNIIIATKSGAGDSKTLLDNLETSLKNLKTDYIDIYQLHGPENLPEPGESGGIYETLLKAKEKGMIRFIGITNHRLHIAMKAAVSGLYDTVQFPLSSLSSDEELKLIDECKRNDIGVIAMKPLSGGLITKAAPTFAFLRQFGNLIPIWGIQRISELDEFIAMENNPPVLDDNMMMIIEKDRTELKGAFCRGCGYCLPCSARIPIPMAARISLLLTRAPYRQFLTDSWRDSMELITGCTGCGHCKKHCPYELDTPNLLKAQLSYYREFYARNKSFV